MKRSEFIKFAARGDQLLKLVGSLVRNKPTGALSGPAEAITKFRGGNVGGRSVPMRGKLSGGTKLNQAYLDSVFGDPKNLGKTIQSGLGELVPEARQLESIAGKNLLSNISNRQPLRDLMAKNLKNYRTVARQGKKKPQLKSDTIAIP
jgi:hypothetical protein